MRIAIQTGLAAVCVSTGLLAQTHTHPAVSSNHNHRNNQVRSLDFGVFERATGATGRITMPATAGAQPQLSGVTGGVFNVLNAIAAGPATYFIDLQIYDGAETTWESRDRSAYNRRVTLTNGSGGTLYCYLDARSNPWRGNYPFPRFAAMRTEDFYWGGYVDVTNPNQATGVYTGNTSSLNIVDNNFDGASYGFVATEDWCDENDNYGTSAESPNFAIRVELRTPPPALSAVPTSSLHFGAMLRPTSAGTVTVDAATGNRSFVGAITGLPLDPQASRATYLLDGQGSAYVDFVVPATTTIQNPGGDTMTVSLGNRYRILNRRSQGTTGGTAGSTGWFRFYSDARQVTFHLGGELAVAANQPDGIYSGTYTLTFAYR